MNRARLLAFGLAIALSAIAFDLAVLAWGETPAAIARLIAVGTWGTAQGAGQVLFKATSILFAAVAARVALRAGLFNIGVDGSVAVAAVTTGAIGATLPHGISPFLAWPILALVAAFFGAAWALPAAVLRARFGAHEVISGIMLNKIASSLVGWMIAPNGLALGETASVHTHPLPAGARVLHLDRLFASFHGSALNLSILAALAAAIVWSFVARRTVVGRNLAAVGASPTASRAAGIDVGRAWIVSLAVSGAVAGLTALNDVMGYKGYAELGVSSGIGISGLAAALLAGESAVALVLASLLLATLSQGGLSINERIPMDVVDCLVAAILLFFSTAPAMIAWIESRRPASRAR